MSFPCCPAKRKELQKQPALEQKSKLIEPAPKPIPMKVEQPVRVEPRPVIVKQKGPTDILFRMESIEQTRAIRRFDYSRDVVNIGHPDNPSLADTSPDIIQYLSSYMRPITTTGMSKLGREQSTGIGEPTDVWGLVKWRSPCPGDME